MRKSFLVIILIMSFIYPQKDYFQQFVAYDIDVTLNDSLHTLSAFEEIEYTNHSPDELDYLWFHIWPNAYKNQETAYAKQELETGSTRFHFADHEELGFIDSLDFHVNGERIEWEFHPEWVDVVKLNLTDPVKPGETIKIETPFFVKLPEVFSRLGHTGKHYEITQWYPKPAVYDNDGWHPMPYLDQGEFYSEFGTFDVKITLPENYRVMATGDLVNGEKEYAWLDSLAAEGDSLHNLDKKDFKKAIKEMKKKDRESSVKMKTLHFHQENVHDFAWFADPKWIVRKGELRFEESGRKVTLWSMYLPKNAELWENSIEYLNDATYWYSKFYLEYPYNHVSAVDGDLSAGGGMEYPNITVISSDGNSKDLLEYVIMHEVGHNWWYGIIGSNERDHAWLDEGLNEYSNIRYWNKKYGARGETVVISDFIQNKLRIAKDLNMPWVHYLAYALRVLPGDEQIIDMTSTEFESTNYGIMIYFKTAIFTYYLEHYLGEEKMNKIMHDFYSEWKFKHPQPEDFRAAFEKHTDVDLSWYFDDALNSTNFVDFKIKKKGNSVTISKIGEMDAPVEIAYFDNDGILIDSKWLEEVTGKSMVLPENANYAVISPDGILPELSKTNNSTKKPSKFNFVFDVPDYNRTNINWLPWLFSINEYNSWTPGMILYSGFIPTLNYGISAKPMYDFANNQIVGSIKVQKTFYQIFGFRELKISTEYSDFEGRSGAKFSFDGLLRKPIYSTPATNLKATIYTHAIDRDAVTSRYYSSGKFMIGDIGIDYHDYSNPLIRYDFSTGITSSFCKNEFAKLYAMGKIRWRSSKKMTTYLRGWMGHFLNDKYIPRQYRNYLGGGVDPNFETGFVFNRLNLTDNSWPPIYERQYIEDGAGLRGVAMQGNRPLYSNETSWGINFTQVVKDLPIRIFVDYAGGTDLDEHYFDAGIQINLSSIIVYLPFYQSWDEESFIKDFDSLKERIRFEISIPKISI